MTVTDLAAIQHQLGEPEIPSDIHEQRQRELNNEPAEVGKQAQIDALVLQSTQPKKSVDVADKIKPVNDGMRDIQVGDVVQAKDRVVAKLMDRAQGLWNKASEIFTRTGLQTENDGKEKDDSKKLVNTIPSGSLPHGQSDDGVQKLDDNTGATQKSCDDSKKPVNIVSEKIPSEQSLLPKTTASGTLFQGQSDEGMQKLNDSTDATQIPHDNTKIIVPETLPAGSSLELPLKSEEVPVKDSTIVLSNEQVAQQDANGLIGGDISDDHVDYATLMALTATGTLGIGFGLHKAYQYWVVAHAQADKLIANVMNTSTENDCCKACMYLEKLTGTSLRVIEKPAMQNKTFEKVVNHICHVKSNKFKKLLMVMLLKHFKLSVKNQHVIIAKLALS